MAVVNSPLAAVLEICVKIKNHEIYYSTTGLSFIYKRTNNYGFKELVETIYSVF